jgi:hypothetical protein
MVSGVKTLQFQGQFQQLPVLIMLDSGSSSSFISTQLVSRLSLMTDPCQTVSVRVANGDIMHCSSFLSGAAWSFHHYQFQHDLKVLPLTSYDIILGMDWLQLFSPMKVDWHQQWLAIPYKGTTVWLYSIFFKHDFTCISLRRSRVNKQPKARCLERKTTRPPGWRYRDVLHE